MFKELMEIEAVPKAATPAPKSLWILDESIRMIYAKDPHHRLPSGNCNVAMTLTK